MYGDRKLPQRCRMLLSKSTYFNNKDTGRSAFICKIKFGQFYTIYKHSKSIRMNSYLTWAMPNKSIFKKFQKTISLIPNPRSGSYTINDLSKDIISNNEFFFLI